VDRRNRGATVVFIVVVVGAVFRLVLEFFEKPTFESPSRSRYQIQIIGIGFVDIFIDFAILGGW
jgi:hypothetical protein